MGVGRICIGRRALRGGRLRDPRFTGIRVGSGRGRAVPFAGGARGASRAIRVERPWRRRRGSGHPGGESARSDRTPRGSRAERGAGAVRRTTRRDVDRRGDRCSSHGYRRDDDARRGRPGNVGNRRGSRTSGRIHARDN
jgi:hypothetical protein